MPKIHKTSPELNQLVLTKIKKTRTRQQMQKNTLAVDDQLLQGSSKDPEKHKNAPTSVRARQQ